MEENQKYRQTLKNVLEFSPAVLQRFVNFMNNPDEKTAVEQFGRGDKYFGCAVLLATMPGLPMLGHGQVEGFTEKYGMEYRRAYWDEPIDQDMVRRHEREIFPLLRRRYLFSDAAEFALYDFETDGGWVDENVFAYSNRRGDQAALVLYNNAYDSTTGRVRLATPVNRGPAEQPRLERRSLAEALGLDDADGGFWAWRDHIDGLEYLERGGRLAGEGFRCSLHGYQARVLLDFRRLPDPDGGWAALADELGGAGVPDLGRARQRRELGPVLAPVRAWMTPTVLDWLQSGPRRATAKDADGSPPIRPDSPDSPDLPDLPDLPADLGALATRLRALPAGPVPAGLGKLTRADLEQLLDALPHSRALQAVYLAAVLVEAASPRHDLPADAAGILAEDVHTAALDWLDDDHAAGRLAAAARALAALPDAAAGLARGRTTWLGPLLALPEARPLLGLNDYEGRTWLVAESLDDWLRVLGAAALAQRPAPDPVALLDAVALVRQAAADAGFELAAFRARLGV
ncbi:MAG: hypothetical protein R6X35_11890 [Candidatus Krumholzibacteriia bacterium]